MDHSEELIRFIKDNPTNFHVIEAQSGLLEKSGYVRLSEGERWSIIPGGKYYTVRNGSAIIAFRIPSKEPGGFMIMASHSDSPYLKVKPGGPLRRCGAYSMLNVEVYGGAILYSWLDRPLSIAGRAYVRDKGGVVMKTVKIDRDLVLIPSLAIHMQRDVNSGFSPNPQKDMLPLIGGEDAQDPEALVAEELGIKREDLVSAELCLYNRTAPSRWGEKGEFISSPKLDDVQCAYSSLCGLLESAPSERSIAVHAVFDNEEVGSVTKQGAASTFLSDTLRRMTASLGYDDEKYHMMLASSFMLSADNAHSVHPNHEEKADPVNRPVMGGGVVLKFAGNQKYSTDAASEAVFRELCAKGGVKSQTFANRSDLPGGSTLGNISSQQVPVMTAAIGLAQLAMHSSYETASGCDTEEMIKLAQALYSSDLHVEGSGFVLS